MLVIADYIIRKQPLGAFNQEKALVGAFSVIVQPVVEPMEHYTALAPDVTQGLAVGQCWCWCWWTMMVH